MFLGSGYYHVVVGVRVEASLDSVSTVEVSPSGITSVAAKDKTVKRGVVAFHTYVEVLGSAERTFKSHFFSFSHFFIFFLFYYHIFCGLSSVF